MRPILERASHLRLHRFVLKARHCARRLQISTHENKVRQIVKQWTPPFAPDQIRGGDDVLCGDERCAHESDAMCAGLVSFLKNVAHIEFRVGKLARVSTRTLFLECGGLPPLLLRSAAPAVAD